MAENAGWKAHVATYNSVMSVLKWGAIVCFVIAMAVIFMIAG